MKKKTNWFSIGAVMILPAIFVLNQPEYCRGKFPKLFGLKEIGLNVYANPTISDSLKERILNVVNESLLRNKKFFKTEVSMPRIIYCNDQKEIDRFNNNGNNAHAVSIFTPIGHHLVINNTGLDVDIVSHELCHSVFFNRLGFLKWLKLTYNVSVWFDEGLAMQVDFRSSFSEERWLHLTNNGRKAPSLVSISDSKHFYDSEKAWYNYATSKHEVKKAIEKKGIDSLLQFIEEINFYSDFNQEYTRFFFDTPIVEDNSN